MPKQQVKEADIQRAIKEYLQYHGWFVYKNHQSLGSHRGVADLTAVKDGRVIWVEVKRPGGKLSQDQHKFMAALVQHGGIYLLARSVDELERVLEGMGNAAAT